MVTAAVLAVLVRRWRRAWVGMYVGHWGCGGLGASCVGTVGVCMSGAGQGMVLLLWLVPPPPCRLGLEAKHLTPYQPRVSSARILTPLWIWSAPPLRSLVKLAGRLAPQQEGQAEERGRPLPSGVTALEAAAALNNNPDALLLDIR